MMDDGWEAPFPYQGVFNSATFICIKVAKLNRLKLIEIELQAYR